MGNLIWMVVDFSAPYSLMNCSGEIVMRLHDTLSLDGRL